MNALSFYFAIFAGVLLSYGIQARAELIGHWPLNETEGEEAVDFINGNNGIWQNQDFDLEWIEGRVGGAAMLTDTGLDSYFLIETIDQLIDAEGMTIAMWIDPETQSSSGYNGIFMTRTINDRDGNSWGVAYEADHLDTRVEGPGIDSAAGSIVPEAGWYHVAMVWDGVEGTHTQYVNGEETNISTNAFSGQILETSGPWYIGYDDCCGNIRDFDGAIDDIGVWNEPLEPEEIALLAGGVSPPDLGAADLDDDGLPNTYEEMFEFLDPNNAADAAKDQDEDGLSNLGEFKADTDPTDTDTDGDSLTDGQEVNDLMSNPKLTDTDGDELTDGDEVNTHKTSPILSDSDNDGFLDNQEIADGTDPNDPLSPAPPEPGLIAYWPLDETEGETATDTIGGYNGIWQNEGENLEWVEGQVGGAARLTDGGGDSYFQIDSIARMVGVPAVTISAWIDPEVQSSSGYNGVFMTRTINAKTGNSWGIAFEADHLDTRVNGPGIDSSEFIDTEEGWYHVTMVWNGGDGSHTQYVNGVESATGSVFQGRIAETSGPWYIGYDDCCGNNRDFDGVIDDVAIWDKALSAEEVEEVYTNGLEGIGAGGGAGFVLRFTDIAVNADGSVTIKWSSRQDHTYLVRYTADLSAPVDSWIELDDGIESGGAETSFTTGPFADSPSEAYLVVIED